MDVLIGSNEGAYTWLQLTLYEGKNREIKRALEQFNLKVNRLIRSDFGPYSLQDLPTGCVLEVPVKRPILQLLGKDGEEGSRSDRRARRARRQGKHAKAKERAGGGKVASSTE
jgi:23S rRNA pseudouridine2605 synthase